MRSVAAEMRRLDACCVSAGFPVIMGLALCASFVCIQSIGSS